MRFGVGAADPPRRDWKARCECVCFACLGRMDEWAPDLLPARREWRVARGVLVSALTCTIKP